MYQCCLSKYLQLFSRTYFMRALNRCSSLSFSCACKNMHKFIRKIIRKNILTFTIRHDIIQQYVMKRKQSSLSPQRILRCGSGSYCTAARDLVRECNRRSVDSVRTFFIFAASGIRQEFLPAKGNESPEVKNWIRTDHLSGMEVNDN